ncbi:MAG: SPOR domain-containing protein [Treponema sp.]|nr:SPOR domain-containing protein [Treponema sp.]
MKKSTLCLIAALFTSFALYSQEITAKKLSQEAVAKKSPEKAIEYLNSKIPGITVAAEKRAAYAFLASVQERLALFSDAQKSYASAAGIAAGDAAGMPKKSSERLVLDATRCALSEGNWENAEIYLNSAVRNSKNPEIIATIKLYEQWAALCKAENQVDLIEPIAMLKAYLQIPSMESIKRQVLLTLWFLTGDEEFANTLKNDFAKSAEAEIVNGKVQLYPAPFWYFTPKNYSEKNAEKTPQKEAKSEESTSQITIEKVKTQGKEEIDSEKAIETSKKAEQKNNSSTEEKPIKQQLGLFRDKTNAQNFVSQLNDKGFTAYIQEEKRDSGTIYYSVVVDENESATMSDQLRSAGFECYPIFKE